MTHDDTSQQALSSSALLCAFALGRGAYCEKPHRHLGTHGPRTKSSDASS